MDIAKGPDSAPTESGPQNNALSPTAHKNLTKDGGESQLSIAVRECRIRVARDDIHSALGPVSRHTEAALLSLELDDDEGLAHHLRHVVDGVNAAARVHRDLRRYLSVQGSVR